MGRSTLRLWCVRGVVVVLLVALAAVLAATAGAVDASVLTKTSYSPSCGLGSGFLDSLAARAPAAGRSREPGSSATVEEIPAGEVPTTSAAFEATIPVYIHVIRTGTAVEQGNVPTAWIRT